MFKVSQSFFDTQLFLLRCVAIFVSSRPKRQPTKQWSLDTIMEVERRMHYICRDIKSTHLIYKITTVRRNKNKSYRFVDESFLIKYMVQSYYMWICDLLLHMHNPLPSFVYAFTIVLRSSLNSDFAKCELSDLHIIISFVA